MTFAGKGRESMKLKRIHARIAWGLVVFAVLSLGFAVLFLGKDLLSAFKVATVAAVVSAILVFYLLLRWFLCPHCEKGVAPPQFRAGKRYYCVRCGKPFIYDDELDEP